QGLFFRRQQSYQYFLEGLVIVGENDVAEISANNLVGRLNRGMWTNDSEIHFARPRAITEFNAGNRQKFLPDFLFDHRFAHDRNFVETSFDWSRHPYDRAQNRQHRLAKHWLELAGRARQEKNMWRFDLWIDVRLQIQTRGAAVFV